jgi:hypothetical protein
MANEAFAAFTCYHFDTGSDYLIVDVSVECNTRKYWAREAPVAWIVVGVYAFGLILLNGLLLFKARRIHAVV